jgi:hypothetical protein
MRLVYTGPPTTPTARPLRAHAPAPGRTDGKGLDLAVHYADVRATVRSFCSITCEAHEIDPEDLIGAVAESVLASNLRDSAYDPRRASITRYLRTLAVSRLLHLVDKLQRRARAEQVGMWGRAAPMDPEQTLEQNGLVDAATIAVGSLCPNVLITVGRLLPAVVARAQAADDEAQRDGPPSALPETGDEQGWREQAVQWVVLDSPSSAAAAGWWRCTVREANARLTWARQVWGEAVEEIPGGLATRRAAPRSRTVRRERQMHVAVG